MLTRCLGKDSIFGIRATGLDIGNLSVFVQFAIDYKAFGNFDNNLIAFWKGYFDLILETNPSEEVKQSISCFLEPSAPTPAPVPAPIAPPTTDSTPALAKVVSPVVQVAPALSVSPTPTAAKSAPSPPPPKKARLDPRLEQPGVIDHETTRSKKGGASKPSTI